MKSDSSLMIVFISSLLTFIGTLTVQYFTNQWGLTNQIKINDRQKRQQVFGQLMGRKFITTQLYVSRFEAFVFSDYHEALWKLAGYPKDSLDLQEAQRWMHRSEELTLEIARNNQGLFEIIGSICTLFPATTKFQELINRIYQFKTPKVEVPPSKADASQLETWKTQAVKELQELVEREYAKPINDLLNHLASEIAQEQE